MVRAAAATVAVGATDTTFADFFLIRSDATDSDIICGSSQAGRSVRGDFDRSSSPAAVQPPVRGPVRQRRPAGNDQSRRLARPRSGCTKATGGGVRRTSIRLRRALKAKNPGRP
jgi:hypothetical protein